MSEKYFVTNCPERDHEDHGIAAHEELKKAEQLRTLNQFFRPTQSGMIKTQLIDAYN